MSNQDFPLRTAGELTLPNGRLVWVCTLNTLLREQAELKARKYAGNECRELLKGGQDYPAVVAEIRSFSPEKQAQLLAGQEYWKISEEAVGKFPDPPEPEQGDLEPDKFAAALQKWEADCKAAQAKRDKHVQSRYDSEVKRALALTEKVRIERCTTVHFAREYSQHFVQRLAVETLYRAVRLSEDHSARYFRSAEGYVDADDEIQKACSDFYYHDLDSVKPDQVPT